MEAQAKEIPTTRAEAVSDDAPVKLESCKTPDGHAFYVRPGTEDAGVFRYVVDANEYRLPARFTSDDVIIDVGAHIGSFSYAVLMRGAGRVYVYEAHPVNHAIACKNLARFAGRVFCSNKAVWRSDEQARTLFNNVITDDIPTGGISVLWNNEGIPAGTVGLDELIAEASGGLRKTIRLLKLDCEGAEYPILFSAKHLAHVEELCGEYHEIEPERVPDRAKVPGRPEAFSGYSLKKFLESEGWSVELEPLGKTDGLFFARQKQSYWLGGSDAGAKELDVEKLMAEISEAAARSAATIGIAPAFSHDVDRHRSPNWSPAHATYAPTSGYSPATPPAPPDTKFPRLILQPPFRPSPDSRYHVNDLLKFHDEVFVRNAYLAVLKREPDEAGLSQQLALLRGGRFDKIDILAGLRYSPEGRKKNVRVDGLARPAFVRRLGRIPVLGYLFRLCVALGQLPLLLAAQRQFEAYSLAQHQQAAEFVNQVLADLYANAERAAAHQQQLDSLVQTTREELGRLASSHEQLRQDSSGAYSQLRQEVKELREETYNRLAAGAEQMRRQAEASALSVEERLRQLLQKLQQTRAELVLQERRVSLLLEEGRRRMPAPFSREQLQTLANEQRHILDTFYASFADQFRGSRADIKRRLSVYLPYVERAAVAGDVVDIGCGRGEWLEVAREADLSARGVDRNRASVEDCLARGFEVIKADAIEHLCGLPENSLRAVTAFHFIEHLPFTSLLAFLAETLRVLKPGGLVICETPNPENMVVGSCNFYLDPDHRRPLPSALMSFVLEARGFCRVEVVKLNANELARVGEVSELALRFNDFMYGPQDYAVIGWKV